MAMKTTKRILAVLFLSLLQVARAQTPPTPPNGWTSQAKDGAIVLLSPDDEHGARLKIAIFPPAAPRGKLQDWYDSQTRAILRGMPQQPQQIGDVLEDGGILVRQVGYEKQRMAMYGYRTASGLSLCIVIAPSDLDSQDQRADAAIAYVRQLAAQRFELAAAANQSRQPMNQPGQYNGQFGRSDMDLTYHAKAIPSKDQDVPLKGAYLFVGTQFGASYGGVGTAMTWGPKSTALLLLLFANGVAAKFDARGGNLAGRYQAEGFASLDVTNPSIVSGVPFGQWTEDGNTVQIRWNGGQTTALAENGQNLDGAGQHWAPFVLADGVTLEGTFVRKMEAGLRSQVLVLHSDGTFAGDGLNVTMGGSAVNPAFPARGGGRYEVRKGSMILYFANGFTQSIACTLSPPNSSEANVVLLNEFPFERVR